MLFSATFGDGVITTLAVICIGWLSYRKWFRKQSKVDTPRRKRGGIINYAHPFWWK
jgi:hypothetical protein